MQLAQIDVQHDRLLLEKVLENSDNGIVISDSQNSIIAVNKAFTSLMGYAPEEIIGKSGSFLRSGRYSDTFYADLWKTVETQGIWEGELWVRRKSGQVFLEWLSLSTVKDNQNKVIYYLTLFSDITERKATAERIESLLHYDPLTGLPNRTTFYTLLSREIDEKKSTAKKIGILLISLNSFSRINDAYGFAAGDYILQKVAERLKNLLKNTLFLARVLGDEFAFGITQLHDPEEVAHFTQTVLDQFQEPIIFEGKEISLSANGGISMYPDDGKNPTELIKNADTAVSYAKKIGKGGYQFFTPAIQENVIQRLILENNLRQAITKQALVLYYQPVVDLHTGKIRGAEALARWYVNEKEEISPGKFIPLAEQIGLIVPLTQWALESSCVQTESWQKMGYSLRIGVNITFVQFKQKDFLNDIKKMLERHHIKPENLKLELTESIVMEDAEMSIALLHELKKMGIYLSVDDFGTGYSSLSYLLKLPIDELKIDQSFVKGIATQPKNKEIIQAIITLAKSLKLTVLAEGVETKEQLDFMRAVGCDEIQGFYFSKPVTAEALTNMLLKDERLV